MDPNANLEEQLKLARHVIDRDDEEPVDDADVERLAELVVALDTWVRGGGFLPRAWKR